MRRRLPPLNAVRAFEAAARHRSFLLAADELAVTPGAVSQQIKGLEEWLGVALFRRLPRGVLLTDAGQTYWPQLSELLDGLEGATRRIMSQDASPVLTVSTMPSFAARSLIPRLGRFSARHPQIELRIMASSQVVDFARSDVDLAVRYGDGQYPGLRADLLMTNDVFPVCSPRLLEGPRPLRQPADLRQHTLLHDEPHDFGLQELGWADWLAAARITGIDTQRGPRFTYTHMTLQAAVEGQGVALAPGALVAQDLASGNLVRPFAFVLRDHYSLYVVAPEQTADRPNIVAFRSWALDEAAAQWAAA